MHEKLQAGDISESGDGVSESVNVLYIGDGGNALLVAECLIDFVVGFEYLFLL
jgi:hypothetical protein